jgi:putative aldouronate transport system permease protein
MNFKSGLKSIRLHWQMYIIILLPVIYIIVFHYIPMYGIQLAFKKFYATKGITGSPWVGFHYFEQFFKSPSNLRIIFNTFSISLYSIAAGFPFPILLAIGLNELKNSSFKKSVQMVTYAPYFISTVVMVGMILQILEPRVGIVNNIIKLLGGESINFMGKPEFFKSIYVWSGIWQNTGYSAVIYIAALSSVSMELREACIIDGANKFQRIMNVDIPGIMPTITIILILNFGFIMSVGFEKILLMQNSLNASASEIITTYVYKVGLISANFSFGTAIGVFNSIVNLVLLLGANFMAKRIGDTSLW